MTVVNPQLLVDNGNIRKVKEGQEIDSNQIQQVGVDLTIDKIYEFAPESVTSIGISDRQLSEHKELIPTKLHFKKYLNKQRDYEVVTMEKAWRLKPGYYMWDSNEYCSIPEDMMSLIVQRSTLLKSGIQIISSVWDPGFHGVLGSHMIVHREIQLEKGSRVAQIVTWKAESSSQYQGIYLGTGVADLSGLSSSQ